MKDIYEEVLAEYGNKLYGYLLKMLLSPEDAEDILQNVFMSFIVKIPSINPDKYASYLFRMAHNKAINHLKKEKKYVPYHHYAHEQPQSEEKESTQNNEMIKKAFNKLKPKELLAVELQIYQKKSYREIAEIMNTSISAIDSLLFRAKNKLRKYLQDK